MKSSYKIIIIGAIITGLWLSGLIWIQITHIPIAFIGSISTSTHLENGMEVKTFGVDPDFSMIPIIGVSLLVLGLFFIILDKRK